MAGLAVGALAAGICLHSLGLSPLNGQEEPSKPLNSVNNPSATPLSSSTPSAAPPLKVTPSAVPTPSPKVIPSPVPTRTPPPEASEGTWLIVTSISEQRLYLYDGRKLFRQYPISTGKETTPTPLGRWRISEKIELRLGTEYGSRWMRLERFDSTTGWYQWTDYGIHGTNEEDKIGSPVSAGCIRLRNADVEELYALVPIGTLVLTVP